MSDASGLESKATGVEEVESHEGEEVLTQTVSRFEHRDQKDWLESLRAEAPNLLLDFCSGIQNQGVRLTEAAFAERFSWCLDRLAIMEIPVNVVMELFSLAVDQGQQFAAFTHFQNAMEGPEVSAAYAYLEVKRARLASFRRFLIPDSPPPHGMTEWSQVWMGSLDELIQLISGQITRQEQWLAEVWKFLRTAKQLQIESYLLAIATPQIRDLLAQHRLPVSRHGIMVAYAHASQLIPHIDSSVGGNPIEAMKMRLSRARRSPKRMQVLSLLFMQLAATRRQSYGVHEAV